MVEWLDHGRISRTVFALTLLAAVSVPISTTTAAEGATLKGFLAYETRPAEGWRAIFVDSNNEEFASNPADAVGEYSMEVPIGTRYTLVAGFDAAGERFPIANPVPVNVRVHGVYTIPGVIDFRETPTVVDPTAADTPRATTTKATTTKTPKQGLTSKQKKIIGYSVGGAAAAIIAIVLIDDDDNASPSNP